MRTRIDNLTVYDGINGKFNNTSIVFDETAIIAIGPAANNSEADNIIDGKGLICMPGLVNSHVHLSIDGEPNMNTQILRENEADAAYAALRNAYMQVSSGVVSVRDMGAKYNVTISLRNAIDRGLFEGPRIYSSGEVICMTGGHGNLFGIEADGEDEIRKVARKQIKLGANLLKVMATGGGQSPGMKAGATQLIEDEIRVICDEAKKAGRTTAAHAQGKEGVLNCVNAGISSIEHGVYLDDEVVGIMKEKGVYLCATLLSPYYVTLKGIEAGIPAYAVNKCLEQVGPHWESFTRAYKAGVKILAGNDAGTPFNFHDDFPNELIKMVELGMPVREVIKSATYNPAECLGMLDKTGSVEVGKWADLTIIDGDPEIDVNNFKNVKFVYKNGQCIFKK
jgi:imidazolonepropionase-like amidohydrolase